MRHWFFIVTAAFLFGIPWLVLVPAVNRANATSEMERVHFIRRHFSSHAPIRSADGHLRMFGPEQTSLERVALLRFTESFRTAFSRLTGIPAVLMRMDVHLREEPRWPLVPGQIDVLRDGLRARLWVDASWERSPALLETALCSAFLRLWSLSMDPDAPSAPGWLSMGLARAISAEQRESDLEQVIQAWMSARLPPLVRLLADNGRILESFPPAAALVALWLVQQSDGRTPFPPWVFGDVEMEDPVSDTAWETWLMRRAQTVIRPGTTSLGALSRFRALQLIYSGESGIPLNSCLLSGAPLALLLTYRSETWAQNAGRQKAHALRRFSQGRGPRLIQTAETIAAALEALADPVSEAELRERLKAAYRMMDKLEMSLHRGEHDTDGRGSDFSEHEE